MKSYAPYVTDLRRLLFSGHAESSFPKLAEHAVNGEASSRLLELVSPFSLRRTGAFFSSACLSDQAAEHVLTHLARPTLLITDPACGAGNLLLAAAKKLPIKRSLAATLSLWGQCLAGFDLHAEFIRAAHLRLAILAISRGAEFDLPLKPSLQQFFPLIRRGDGLRELSELKGVSHVLINPPFGPIIAPKNCTWAQGKITKAAIFFGRCIDALPPNTHVSGILPDVLRAGSRYQRWREAIEKKASVRRIKSIGNFETADVDVFLLELRTGQKSSKGYKGRWWINPKAKETVGTYFAVHVGAVVPHRLKKNEGPIYPYLHAKGLPFWGAFKPDNETVAFSGKTTNTPFVVIRRTSSPSDRYRAPGTMIAATKSVAVENHLLICIPKSGGVSLCKRLLQVLKRSTTNEFLNSRIRCRHLTVGVVKEIPW